MLPTLQIGPLSIAFPGLIILVGLWVAIYLSERRANVHQVSTDFLSNLLVWSVSAGIIGARLAFLARYPQAFIKNPLTLVSLNPGLLEPAAGIFLGWVVFLIYTKHHKYPLWNVLDALAPGMVFFYIAYHLSQLAAGTAYGLPTSLPWAIQLWGADRHPVQIYAAIAGALVLGWIWFFNKQTAMSAAGSMFLKSLICLSAAHLFTAGFSANSTMLTAGIRVEQVIAWIILAASMWMYRKKTTALAIV
jgi:prolipoprotein diacylglyceryltransferase